MIVSNINLKDDVIPNIIKNIKTAICIFNKNIIIKGKLENNDFKINYLNNFSKFHFSFKKKINWIEEKYSNLKYEKSNIYHISVFKIKYLETELFYIRYFELPKTKLLYFKIINLKLIKNLKKKKEYWDKIINFNSINRNIIFKESEKSENLKTIELFKNSVKKLYFLKNNIFAQLKLYQKLNEKYLFKNSKLYDFFWKILNLKKLIKEKLDIKNELNINYEQYNSIKSFRIKLLKENINSLSNINNSLKLNCVKDLCNKKAKFITLKI